MTLAADTRAAALELIAGVHAGDLRACSPLVFGADAPGRLVSIVEEGAVRSACAVLPRTLRFAGRTLRAGFVGNVTTHPRFRGRGLATRLLCAAEAELAAEGCALALLWADEPGFYESRGWAPLGSEVDLVLEPAHAARLPAPSGVRRLHTGDVDRVHALYGAHADRVERGLAETARLLGAPAMDVLVRAEADAVTAYACVGRGADLFGVVHEWGGPPADVLALLRALLEHEGPGRERGARLFVLAPPSATELRARLEAAGALAAIGIVAMGKVLDPGAVAELAWSAARAATGLRVATCDGATLFTGERGACALDPRELLELVFAPRGARELYAELERELGEDLAGLPLAPFVWGLDSI